MSDFDVIIVGGGIAGASLGAEIVGARRTLIVEAEDQCGYHATGRSAAFYLESYGGPEVANLTLASGDFLRTPPQTFSEQGFLRVRGDLHVTRDEHLGTDWNGGRGSSLLRSGACEHILGHDCGNHRDDQRSNEQSELLHIHGAIASPRRALRTASHIRQIG